MSGRKRFSCFTLVMPGILLLGIIGLSACAQPPLATETAPLSQTTPAQASTVPTPGPGQVYISASKFGPATITVSVGDTVTWTNQDTVTYSITSDTSQFDSGLLGPGETYSHAFTQAGTFPYHSVVNGPMQGSVIVH